LQCEQCLLIIVPLEMIIHILNSCIQIILKKTTPRIWLPTLTLVWGIVATLLGVVQNYSGYLSSRFFLGVAESGLFPGVVFYLSMWYKRNEQHYRVALFFSAASLAGAFGGVLAWVGSLLPTDKHS
jgi:MFS family permease